MGGESLTLEPTAGYRTFMCNLYSLTPKEDDVGRFFRVSHNRRAVLDGEREIVLMSWGRSPP